MAQSASPSPNISLLFFITRFRAREKVNAWSYSTYRDSPPMSAHRATKINVRDFSGGFSVRGVWWIFCDAHDGLCIL